MEPKSLPRRICCSTVFVIDFIHHEPATLRNQSPTTCNLFFVTSGCITFNIAHSPQAMWAHSSWPVVKSFSIWRQLSSIMCMITHNKSLIYIKKKKIACLRASIYIFLKRAIVKNFIFAAFLFWHYYCDIVVLFLVLKMNMAIFG